MGRRNKSKHNQSNYLKIMTTYKCSGDKCGKVWNSAHGWKREPIYCEFCEKKAKVLDIVDEMMNLDYYSCSCGILWISIHDDTGQAQECDCGNMVTSDGSQIRFGRHYTFVCTTDSCKAEWEDFSVAQEHTQSCTTCGNSGDIIGKMRLPQRKFSKGSQAMGKGAHREDCCDMCQDIISQKKGRNCIAYRKINCKLEDNLEGVLSETIITVK